MVVSGTPYRLVACESSYPSMIFMEVNSSETGFGGLLSEKKAGLPIPELLEGFVQKNKSTTRFGTSLSAQVILVVQEPPRVGLFIH